MTGIPPGPLRQILLLLFVFSGFSGLIYESVWAQYLKLFLGHAAYAQALVLAIFMGGMAAGAYLASRYSPDWRNPLRAYALIEGVIGLFGLAFHFLFIHTQDFLHQFLLPGLGHPASVYLAKWSVASLLILPQSVLLGMTFPLMSAGVIRLKPERTGASLSMLYFTNSLGGAVGVLVSGFLLIGWIGLPGTIQAAGALNLLLAVLVLALAGGRSVAPASTAGRTGPETGKGTLDPTGGHRKIVALVLLAAFLTGTASFFYEIGWIRMLSMVLGSSAQAFELMLSAFITGLAFGGLWIRRRLDRIEKPLFYAGYVQILMGLLAALTLPMYHGTFDVMGFLIKNLGQTEGGYVLFILGSHTIALAVMVPATFMAGMTLPLFTFSLVQGGHGEKSIGRVYAANTLGAILGVLAAIHFVMPVLGLKALIQTGALIDVALGFALLALTPAGLKGRKPVLSLAGSALVMGAVAFGVHFDPMRTSGGVFRDGIIEHAEGAEMLFHRDGKTATVHLLRYPDGKLFLNTNGKTDASIGGEKLTGDEATQILAGALPLAVFPEARHVAVIGMGSGKTSHVYLGAQSVVRVDTIEIEETMAEAARGFGEHVARTFTDPRSHIHIEDAKTYFSSQKALYDIVMSEPSNPWISGVASLFSKEFYRYVKGHLNEDGMFVQWLQLYEINLDLVSSVFKALAENFSDYVVYTTGEQEVIILAADRRDLSRLNPWIFQQIGIKKDLARLGIKNVHDLAIRRMSYKAVLQPLFSSSPLEANSDYLPVLSRLAPKSLYLEEDAAFLNFLHVSPVPVIDMLEGRVHQDIMTSSEGNPYPSSRAELLARTWVAHIVHQEAFTQAGMVTPPPPWLRLLEAELGAQPGPSSDDRFIRDSLFQLATHTHPYLPAKELDPMWAALAERPGYERLSRDMKKWFVLHYAAARRDGEVMARIASDILANRGGDLEPEKADYLLAAGLCGHLSRGEKKQAELFRLRFISPHVKKSEMRIDIQLLLSHL